MEKITVRLIQYEKTMVVREPIEIDIENYPELIGKTFDEISEYIKENISEMRPSSKTQTWADNLYDEILDADIVREKDLGTDTEIEIKEESEDDDDDDDDDE